MDVRMRLDIIVARAGLCGSVVTRYFAEQGKFVLILEKRSHIAEYKYYYMDQALESAIKLCKVIDNQCFNKEF